MMAACGAFRLSDRKSQPGNFTARPALRLHAFHAHILRGKQSRLLPRPHLGIHAANGRFLPGMVMAMTPAITQASPNKAVLLTLSPRKMTPIATPMGTRR